MARDFVVGKNKPLGKKYPEKSCKRREIMVNGKETTGEITTAGAKTRRKRRQRGPNAYTLYGKKSTVNVEIRILMPIQPYHGFSLYIR